MADSERNDHGDREADLVKARLARLEGFLRERGELEEATPDSPWLGLQLGFLRVIDLTWVRGRIAGVLCACEGPNCTRPGTRSRIVHVDLRRIRAKTAPHGCNRCWKAPVKRRKRQVRSTVPREAFPREYVIWLNHRKKGTLAKAWRDDFEKFLRDLGSKPPGARVRLVRRDLRRLHSKANSFWGTTDEGGGLTITWRGMRFTLEQWWLQYGQPVYQIPKHYFIYHTQQRDPPIVDMDMLLVQFEESQRVRKNQELVPAEEQGRGPQDAGEDPQVRVAGGPTAALGHDRERGSS